MQATTRITRWQARHWRPGRPQRRTRTLTYREAWRRAAIYPHTPRGVMHLYRDLWRATAHPLLLDALVATAMGGIGVPARVSDPVTLAEDAKKLR